MLPFLAGASPLKLFIGKPVRENKGLPGRDETHSQLPADEIREYTGRETCSLNVLRGNSVQIKHGLRILGKMDGNGRGWGREGCESLSRYGERVKDGPKKRASWGFGRGRESRGKRKDRSRSTTLAATSFWQLKSVSREGAGALALGLFSFLLHPVHLLIERTTTALQIHSQRGDQQQQMPKKMVMMLRMPILMLKIRVMGKMKMKKKMLKMLMLNESEGVEVDGDADDDGGDEENADDAESVIAGEVVKVTS